MAPAAGRSRNWCNTCTRVAGKGQAAGGMAEAIQDSLQYLSDDDLQAIATYLKNSKPLGNPADKQPAYSFGGEAEP